MPNKLFIRHRATGQFREFGEVNWLSIPIVGDGLPEAGVSENNR